MELATEYSAIETSCLMQSSKRRQEKSPVVSYQQENEWPALLHCLHLGNAAHLLGMDGPGNGLFGGKLRNSDPVIIPSKK